jgi:succinate-semialdehyde dehydrogenase/glutarate-semialdehyde dehydrogenase
MQELQSINPSNYQVLGTVTISTEQAIRDKVRFARDAQKEWAALGVAKRVSLLQGAFEDLKARKDEFLLLQSREVGKTLEEARIEFDGAVEYATWYFENAEKHLAPETTFENEKAIHQVFHEPIGVVAVIVPWNFPFSNFVWGALQSLIAGNTVVFKHSEECSLTGKFIEDVLAKHLPEGVFSEVYGAGDVGDILVHQDINMIAFTGSTKVGKHLYEVAGQKFIKSVMELGGSAPGVVFEDADLDSAIGDICFLRLLNQGQVCDGLKRLIVHESIFDDVVQKVAAIFASKKIGVAELAETEVGPLVAKRQLDLLVAQVADATQKGAKVITGGSSREKELGGAFFEPTVLTNVTKDMRVWNEEVFGPVLPVVSFKTEEEALQLANDTPYGLGAYIFTKDTERAQRVSAAIETGMVSVNGLNYVMPCNPFGGCKSSGMGREHGPYGFHEVTQIKVVARSK